MERLHRTGRHGVRSSLPLFAACNRPREKGLHRRMCRQRRHLPAPARLEALEQHHVVRRRRSRVLFLHVPEVDRDLEGENRPQCPGAPGSRRQRREDGDRLRVLRLLRRQRSPLPQLAPHLWEHREGIGPEGAQVAAPSRPMGRIRPA